jgi:leucyl aminopeptidase
MGPADLSSAAKKLAAEYKAKFSEIVGDDLLKQNYPAIHAVGRASTNPPRLIDITWGNKKHPKLTLVGKGVCFDTGGLDIKPAAGMLGMKKDMGGAAHVLGLASLIMHAKLPVRLRVLIPAVENVISGNAYKPGDVINTRKGLTVEIGNTDAEGRVILADALFEASSEKPELILDFATLTGAARVAMGTDISALFTNDNHLANELINLGEKLLDPIWRMPLYTPYRKLIESPIADLNNAPLSLYGGAITAALFLKEFVGNNISWAHFDIMAWNASSSSAHPEGAEAMAIRAVFEYLQHRFSARSSVG